MMGMDRRYHYMDLASCYLEFAPNGLDRMVELLYQFAVLGGLYSEPHRHYHNLDHISSGYQLYRTFHGDMPAPEFFAWMYHDSIYDPGAPDNEEHSAELFVMDNAKIGFGTEETDKIVKLILSTKHIGEKNIITDVDLAGLGFKSEVYDECSARIRLEYGDFSDEEWKVGRTKFLTRFLATERLFVTPDFLQFEAPARENMRRELDGLALK